MNRPNSHRAIHVTALVAGLVAMVVLFIGPAGVVGYLISIAVGLAALLVGHRAAKRSGPGLWMAIVGLVLSYLEVVVSVGLLAVRLARVFSG